MNSTLYITLCFDIQKVVICSKELMITSNWLLLHLILPGVRLYQGIRDRVIPNFAMIAARDFSDRDGGAGNELTGRLDGKNDGIWCQSANNGSAIGSWQLSNGSAVPDDLEFYPIHMASRPGQVGLLRAGSIGSSPYQGMYTCTIPDEDGVNQTLVVWIAGNGAYDDIIENCKHYVFVCVCIFIIVRTFL